MTPQMDDHIDYPSLDEADRLALIESLLGLLPSPNTRDGRATYLAFQLAAQDPTQAYIESAVRGLEEVAPGYFDRVLEFAERERGLRL